jgi:PAS domain S-box-containing protein
LQTDGTKFPPDLGSATLIPASVPRRTDTRAAWRYTVALLFAALAVSLRALLHPWLGAQAPYATVFAAVVLAVWVGGVGPGLVAAITGGLGAFFLVFRSFSDPPLAAVLGAALYGLASLVIIAAGEALRRAREVARRDDEALSGERRRAERARALHAAVVESSEDAIVSKDLEGRVTSWNEGAVRLFGWTAEEAIGTSITRIIPPELHAQEASILQRIRQGERVEPFETVRVAKDGRRLDVSITISPVRDETGRVIGASKIARDIGAWRRAEERLIEADRRKDEFLATLAHELRNPLAPIRNSLEILKLAGVDAATQAGLAAILGRQVEQLARLVDDLLEVSRVSVGQVELRKERMTLSTAIESAVHASRPLIEEAGHRLTIRQPEMPIELDADPVRLSQVLSNLLNNAAKYTPPGGEIELAARSDGSEVVVEVRDNGAGIPSEMLERVFDLFTQVSPGTTRSAGGLGIGLTLVRRLVELHGGKVEAESPGPGQGSTFRVILPAGRVGIASQASHQPALTSSLAPAGALARRILVVDDNIDSAQSLALLLQILGHRVQTALGGTEALATVEAFDPEIVLLDIGMPEMDGYEVARRLRFRFGRDTPRLVALTGFGQEADRARSRSAGFDAHLVKPVDLALLQELLAAPPRGGRPTERRSLSN